MICHVPSRCKHNKVSRRANAQTKKSVVYARPTTSRSSSVSSPSHSHISPNVQSSHPQQGVLHPEIQASSQARKRRFLIVSRRLLRSKMKWKECLGTGKWRVLLLPGRDQRPLMWARLVWIGIGRRWKGGIEGRERGIGRSIVDRLGPE